MAIDLQRYTADYVSARRQVLMDAAGRRNEQMECYEDYYNMDIWEDEPQTGQIRVTSSAAHQTVEDFTALLVTRKHAINVRPRNKADEETAKAQDVETWLYGFRHRTMLDRMLRFSTHNGVKLAVGYLKAVYDPQHAADEFPIRVSSPNPKNVYGRENQERTRFVELVETWQRSRREIEQEWDVTLKRPRRKFRKPEDEQAWLDGLVDYTEYFDEMTVLEAVKDEPRQEAVKKGAVELAVEILTGGENPMQGSGAAYRAGAGEKGKAEPTKRRVRKIVHCALVQDGEAQMVKPAVVLPDYLYIPYFPWGWILTPDGRIGALFAMTNGKGGTKSLGTMQAWNRFMSLFLTIADKVANPAVVTDDDKAVIDTTPGAINTVDFGKKLEYLSSPGVHPNVQVALEELKKEMNAVSVPDVLRGFVVNMSGQAITASASQFEMRIAFGQQDMEAMLQNFYEFVLHLARRYYPEDPAAWTVFGVGRKGQPIEQAFNADWQTDKCWIEVKTSSSLPKDVVGMMGLTLQLVNGRLLSRRQGLDLIQKYMDVGADTPDDALAQILEDEILTSGQVGQQLANQLAGQWVAMMTGRAGGVTVGQVQDAQMLSSNGAGTGFAATSGMPSSVVPPAAGSVGAAGNVAGMAAMLNSQGLQQ